MMIKGIVKPILKWPGGKQSLAQKLVGFFPTDFNVYFEPFVGGASVLLAMNPEQAVIADMNSWLIDAYLAIKSNWAMVARVLDTMKNNKEDFLRIRTIQPESLNLINRAAHLIYLNKTCFRGLFRVNRKGEFNVPYGAYNRRYYDANNLLAFSRILKGVDIRMGDFEDTLQGVTQDDFVYLDPPYYKVGGYSDFNRYTPGQFRKDDHQRLADLCRNLHQRGIRWAMSNSNSPFVINLFKDFFVYNISARREINLDSKRRTITELLITNYEVGSGLTEKYRTTASNPLESEM